MPTSFGYRIVSNHSSIYNIYMSFGVEISVQGLIALYVRACMYACMYCVLCEQHALDDRIILAGSILHFECNSSGYGMNQTENEIDLELRG